MKKFLLICLTLSISAWSIVSGQDISLQNMVPPSPEAAAFAKAGTYDVGPFTGKPDVQIPIYTIKTRSLSVPISLSYDETGIRVDNIASWVGMNWSLVAGGLITRSVMDVPDEGIGGVGGYLTGPPPRVSAITNTQNWVNYFVDKLIQPNPGNRHDLKPDKFYYSFNGRSGSFQFKNDLSIMQIPQTSLQISMQQLSGGLISFQIIDETGTTYIFTTLESSQIYTINGVSNSANTLNLTTGWCLSQIISSDGNDRITFNYETEWSGTQKTNEFTEYYDHNYVTNSPEHNHYWNGMEMTTNSQRLKSIVFTGGKVEFNRVADRQDDLGSRLDNIVIYSSPDNSTYTPLRSFGFQQGYYFSSDDYSNIAPNGFAQLARDRYRLRLDRVILKDAAGNAIANYQLYYNSLMPPPKSSCSQDWWGYSNRKGNHTLIPATTFTSPTTSFQVGGADRSCDETSMKAGILEKIVYPTGGYTVFETEAHRYVTAGFQTNYIQYSAVALGLEGQVHKQVIDFVGTDLIADATPINISFSPYSTSGNPLYINVDDRTGNTVNPVPQVSIRDIATGQVTYFTSPDPSHWTSPTGLTYLFMPKKAYEITVICYNNQNYAQASISFALPTMGTTTSTNIVGGLRIKSIRNYNMDNSLAGQETYAYGQIEDGAGEYTSVMNFSNGRELYQTDKKIDGLSGGPTYQTDVIQWYSGLVFDQTLLQGSPVAYRYVTKYHGDVNNNTGKTVYYYGTDPFFTTTPLPAGLSLLNSMGILVTSNGWANGQLVSQQEFRRESDGSYTPVQTVTNTYNKQVTDADYSLLAGVALMRPPWEISNYQLSDFMYGEVPAQTGFVQLTQTKKDEYLAGQTAPLTTITNYTYDNTHPDFKTGESYTNSKGELMQTTMKYPFNKTDLLATGTLTAAQSTAIDNMVTKNIISSVLEETRTRAGAPVSRKRTPYELVNGSTIAPVNVQLQVGTNPIETRLLYTQYDALGNLLAQQKANDATNAYIWDYQYSYVVAAVNNALQADVAYTSFEADGTGGWSLASTSRDAGSGITGGKSYVLTNVANDIQRTGLTTTTTYVVSYWTTNNAAFSIGGTLSGYPVKGKTVTVNGVQWTYFEHMVTGQSTISITGAGHIDELRLYPAKAQMQSFTYNPLIGVTSKDDVGGRITYYEYDGMGRLLDIRDQDGNIIKTLEYHYQQP